MAGVGAGAEDPAERYRRANRHGRGGDGNNHTASDRSFTTVADVRRRPAIRGEAIKEYPGRADRDVARDGFQTVVRHGTSVDAESGGARRAGGAPTTRQSGGTRDSRRAGWRGVLAQPDGQRGPRLLAHSGTDRNLGDSVCTDHAADVGRAVVIVIAIGCQIAIGVGRQIASGVGRGWAGGRSAGRGGAQGHGVGVGVPGGQQIAADVLKTGRIGLDRRVATVVRRVDPWSRPAVDDGGGYGRGALGDRRQPLTDLRCLRTLGRGPVEQVAEQVAQRAGEHERTPASLHHGSENRVGFRSFERGLPLHRRVQRGSQSPHVARGTTGGTTHPFGGDVGGRTDERARACEGRVALGSRNPEVGQADMSVPAE